MAGARRAAMGWLKARKTPPWWRGSSSSSYTGSASTTPSTSAPPNPLPWPETANPSPLEVFHLPRTIASDKEVKERYYQLVKIYHPDRQAVGTTTRNGDGGGDGDGRPEEALERFKLIVKAYELLSQKASRERYLRTGAGWSRGGGGGKPGDIWTSQGTPRHYSSDFAQSRARGYSYGSFDRHSADDSPWFNNPFDRNPSPRETGTYTDATNASVLAIVSAIAIIGAAVQAYRLDSASHYVKTREEQLHQDASQSLQEAREGRRLWGERRRDEIKRVARIRAASEQSSEPESRCGTAER